MPLVLFLFDYILFNDKFSKLLLSCSESRVPTRKLASLPLMKRKELDSWVISPECITKESASILNKLWDELEKAWWSSKEYERNFDRKEKQGKQRGKKILMNWKMKKKWKRSSEQSCISSKELQRGLEKSQLISKECLRDFKEVFQEP